MADPHIELIVLETPKFPLGHLIATPNALAEINSDEILVALGRHAAGDWGLVDAEDKHANDRALIEGTRLLSAYETQRGTRFWLITEWDRSVTTILLPEDY